VYFRGGFRPLAEANVSLLTHALHYGTGVFDGIRGYWSPQEHELNLFRPREHFERWRSNARLLQMEIPLTPGELCALTAELIRRNGFQCDIYVRPLAFKSQVGVGVRFLPEMEFALVAIPFGVYVDSSRGLRVAVSNWRRVDDNALPARGKICGSYVNSALAEEAARADGYDEAIFLTAQGRVSEGSAANIFLVRRGELLTPAVSENILEGITRATLLEMAGHLGIHAIERGIARSELYAAEEIFLAGTAYEIAPIVAVDRRAVGDGRIGPVTRKLQAAFAAATRGTSPRYSAWRWPVYRAPAAGPARAAAPSRATAEALETVHSG
jgi:branched-chain amino acid aminotransferase